MARTLPSTTLSLTIGGVSIPVDKVDFTPPTPEPEPSMPALEQSVTIIGSVRPTLVLGVMATLDQN